MIIKKIFQQFLFILTVLFTLSGCKKFLNIVPSRDAVNPTKIADFKEMLNSDSLAICNFMLVDIMSDDIFLNPVSYDRNPTYYSRSYTWDKTIWNLSDADPSYSSSYKRILQMNIILSKIDGAIEDEVNAKQQKNIVRAQALINRAWYYLQLVNIYGNDYQPSTAQTDLSIPLILQPNASLLPPRAAVQQVYNQIIQDLNEAISMSDLPGLGEDILHPGKASAFALLARAYLYMGNYNRALESAGSSLALRNTLLDYKTIKSMPSQLQDMKNNSEILLARICTDEDFFALYQTTFQIDPGLRKLFGDNDLRFSLNFFRAYNLFNGRAQFFDYSLRVSEVMLIKAECLARNGNGNEAVGIVNELRKSRLKSYQPIGVSAADALTVVLEERRRELFYHGGLRLFDLKRLNRDRRFTRDLKRLSADGAIVLATLSAGSPQYLIPFAPAVVSNNPNIKQNSR